VRRPAAPWWEELDREAFRFPAARSTRIVRPAKPASDATAAPVRAPASAAPAARTEPRRRAEFGGRADAAERNLPVARPTLRRHERPGFKPDRAALWALILGLFLILVAAASAHAAVAHHLAHLVR
jgi:hypothetical protein